MAVLLFPWMVFIILLDAAIAVSVKPLPYLFMTAGPLLIVLGLWLIIQGKWLRICFLFALIPLIVLPFVDITPRKPYTRFYRSLKVGMNVDQIEKLLVKNFPDGGQFKRPVTGGYGGDKIQFILDPDDGCYNAELIELKMGNGKLIAKDYLPD